MHIYAVFIATFHQGSETRVIPKKLVGFWVKPVEKTGKKPTTHLIQFQFVASVAIKDFFTAYNDPICNKFVNF